MAKAIFERSEKPLYRVRDGETLTIKRCGRCQTHKAVQRFQKDASRKDGYMTRCKACCGTDEQRVKTDPEVLKERQRGYDAAYKERLRERATDEMLRDRSRLHPDGTKKCIGPCGATLPLEAFWQEFWRPDGLQVVCRVCDMGRKLRLDMCDLLAYWEELDLWRCDYCGGPFEDIEHVIPRAQGGTDDINNLRPSCANCNRGPGGKFAMTPAQWRPDEEAALWAVVCNR